MSDEHHVEPENPRSDVLVDRLFAISMAGVLAFIAVVFAFIIL